MKIKPTNIFCGCCTLLFGVELCALLNLIGCICIIATVSSVHNVRIAGMSLTADLQVLNAAWALLGIPIIVCAGVGAVYRIESHLRLYYYYLWASFFLTSAMLINILTIGDMCRSAVPDEVKQMGESFVCAITDSFVYFWLFIIGFIHLYFIYIVWSASEEILRQCYPALLSYKERLETQSKLSSNLERGGMPVARGMPMEDGSMGMPVASGHNAIPVANARSAPALQHGMMERNFPQAPAYGSF